jgi:uncharacterized membrane protein (UPF0127 family)
MSEENKIKPWHWIILALVVISFFSLKLYSLHWPEANIKLGEYDGMIFIFNNMGKQGIVMRDMEFKIDIVWIKNGEIVDIAPDVKLEPNVSEANLTRYYPRIEANVVLELPAGWVEEYGLRLGDRLEVIQ